MSAADDLAWQRAQVGSGVVFSAFLVAHLLNQAVAALGQARYDAVQERLRAGYQSPPVEWLAVFLALLVHLVTALVRWRRRPKAMAPLPPRLRLQRLTGRFLSAVIVGHITATRVVPGLAGVHPGFAGVAFTFEWVPAFFWPYYLLLAVAGWYHLVAGLSTAAGGLRRSAVFWAVVAVGGAAMTAGVLGLGGVLADVGHPASSPYARLLLGLVRR
ncbi:MAG: hypothetical protein INH41_16270 [Myxococcaceae bacterium]|nr:hypothetical protein [Myxococcaceae bacterium]MCA3013937.1 hypothetical protein [Myxococcaceae bacterium]